MLCWILSCYGAETEGLMCCNTCEDVREAYRRKGWAFNNPKVGVVCMVCTGCVYRVCSRTE